jgi:hypothetical protein
MVRNLSTGPFWSRLNSGRSLLWAAAFSLVYTFSPLFSSNQNTYFLHAFARANVGGLAGDWLAQTHDPFPLFSFIVYITLIALPAWTFIAYQVILTAIYFLFLFGIVRCIFGMDLSSAPGMLAAIVLLALHSAPASYLGELAGLDPRELFTQGVAYQLVLGTVFQPSLFGVLLLVSIHQSISDRPLRSVALAAAAAAMHASYYLPAATLVLATVWTLWKEGKPAWQVVLACLIPLAIVSPFLVYTLTWFRPVDPVKWEAVLRILFEVRTPHHSDPAAWFDFTTPVRIILILGALAVVRKTRLVLPLGLLFAVSFVLTLAQVLTHNLALSHLFPWRASVILTPISTAILIARGVALLDARYGGRVQPALFGKVVYGLLVLLVLAGIAKMVIDFSRRRSASEAQVAAFVRKSMDCKAPFLVPLGFEDFRLAAGAPIVVDWKSFPYSEDEFLEWYRRTREVRGFYEESDSSLYASKLRRLIEEYRISGLVTTKNHPPVPPALGTRVFRTPQYEVYSLAVPGTAGVDPAALR